MVRVVAVALGALAIYAAIRRGWIGALGLLALAVALWFVNTPGTMPRRIFVGALLIGALALAAQVLVVRPLVLLDTVTAVE